jgi:hypothetical protein
MGSIYTALPDASKYIRLLSLEESRNEDVLECTLTTVERSAAPPYGAISYLWGEPEPTRRLTVNGLEVDVRYNCSYALRQISTHRLVDYYWIDALCINQSNIPEKSSQVQMMGSIFAGAQKVLASLGQYEDDTELIFEELSKWPSLQIQPAQDRSDPEDDWFTFFEGFDGEYWRPDILLALRSIAKRPYWQRLWVLQEVILARDLLFFCGKGSLNWNLLKRLYDSAGYMWSRDSRDVLKSEDPILMPTMLEARSVPHKTKRRTISIEWNDLLLRQLKCSNPLDHVYGLLELLEVPAKCQSPMRVDYSKPIMSLALECLDYLEESKHLCKATYEIIGLFYCEDTVSSIRRFLAQMEKRATQAREHMAASDDVPNMYPDRQTNYRKRLNMRNVIMNSVPDQFIRMPIRANGLAQLQCSTDGRAIIKRSRDKPGRTDALGLLRKWETECRAGHYSPRLIYDQCSELTALATSETKDGDYLIELEIAEHYINHFIVCLVLRPAYKDRVFHVIGQALLEAGSPPYHFHNNHCTRIRYGEKDALVVHFHKEELMTLICQDSLFQSLPANSDLGDHRCREEKHTREVVERLSSPASQFISSYAVTSYGWRTSFKDCGCFEQK